MADCTGKKQNKKKNKRAAQNSSSSGSSPEAENGAFGDKEILRYLIAAQSDDTKTLAQYLQNGMPVDTKCLMFLDTALHKACRTGSIKAACLLLNHGADIATKTDDGQSTLHIAVKNRQPDIIKVLLSYGASPDVRAEPSGITPLMLAASMTNTAIVSQLIQTGSNLNLQDESGMCALHHCFSYYQERSEFIANSVDCVQLLVEAGADIHLRDNDLKFPLTRAIQKMNMRAVRYFLAQNADPDNHCLRYHSVPCVSPLAFAVFTQRHQMGNLLWYAGATCHSDLLLDTDLSAFAFSQPRSLKEASRKCFRDHFRFCGTVGQNFCKSVDALGLPLSLKDFILLKEHWKV